MSTETIALDKPAASKDGPVFSFRRLGGLDQVILKTDEEWQNLNKLDPKLWMALSCPTHGLEFSQETLELLDSDNDGRIRMQEVLDAVAWVCERLAHPSVLSSGQSEISLDNLRADTPAGESLIAAMKLVQEKHNREDDSPLKMPDVEEVIAEAASYPFNGDGIVPPDSAPASSDADPAHSLSAYIDCALKIIGAKKDASGKPGLDDSLDGAFRKRLEDVLTWRKNLAQTHLPLGEQTGAAWDLLGRIAPKIDDYFYRCRLALYAPEAIANINGEQILQNLTAAEAAGSTPASDPITLETLASLPISRITSVKYLNLTEGVNPAWTDDLENLRLFAASLLNRSSESFKTLSETDWEAVKKSLQEYGSVLAKKPSYPLPPADAAVIEMEGFPALALAPAEDPFGRALLPVDPDAALASLTDEQIGGMLNPHMQNGFRELVEKDLKAPPLAAFQDLRKLGLFHANLYTFLMNYLSFLDFYEPDKKAIFQAGTLYLDSRGCLLCVPVTDVDNHARLADQSHLCLIYCNCTRLAADAAPKTETIAAALTTGNLVSLIEGRHGVFVDNAGQEWDTEIVRVVHNPISLKEAVWAPYIRVANMIGEQVQKFVASKDQAVADATTKTVTDVQATAKAAAKKEAAEAPKPAFDFAKGAGIFAALSVALSVLSAAFAYIANSVASLGWWWPLAIIIVFCCISGPSVLMAWFKLRKRSLGPLLDASGWAVNKGTPINLIMGASLTSEGKLPKNAARDLNDPYGLPAMLKKRRRRIRNWLIFLFILLVCCGGVAAYWFLSGQPDWWSPIKALFAGKA